MFKRLAQLLLAALAWAAGQAGADTGSLQITQADGSLRAVASLETSVDLQIRGLIAEVQVKQRFRNEGAAWQEGNYLLPLPEGAAVHAMTLHIGSRVIVGEIREKEAARSEYNQAVAAGRKASLVEAQSANLFRTAIANVAPGESVEVDIRYSQQVDYRDGQFSLVFPMTYTPRYGAAAANGIGAAAPAVAGEESAFVAPAPAQPAVTVGAPTVTVTATLDAGLELAQVSSDTHAIQVKPQGRLRQIHLHDRVVAPDRDFVLRWAPPPSSAPTAALLREQRDGEQFALLMLLPPTLKAPVLPRELILVIDTSGSMSGDSIVQARAALDAALQRLTPQDRFNVIQFNSVTEALFPQAVDATASDIKLARDWVAGLQATGGTEMLPALQQALAGRPDSGHLRQIVFVTDGAVERGDALYALLRSQLADARLFPVGIGSAPNAYFLRRAAALGRGTATTIRDLHEVSTRMQQLFDKLDRPALRNLQLQLPVAYEAYPAQLPDLYAGEPLQIVFKIDAAAKSGGRIELGGERAGQPWSQQLRFDLDGQAAGVGRLWAQRRIEALDDELHGGAYTPALQAEIVSTALKYSLVSPYTSLVAVDRTPQRSVADPLQTVNVANADPAGSLAFAQTATSARLWLALGLLCLLLAGLLRAPVRGQAA